jgi:hypothetical protein
MGEAVPDTHVTFLSAEPMAGKACGRAGPGAAVKKRQAATAGCAIRRATWTNRLRKKLACQTITTVRHRRAPLFDLAARRPRDGH